ncbi:MAG: hypothetical protein ACLSAH_19820 [Bilophila wadsworthia]
MGRHGSWNTRASARRIRSAPSAHRVSGAGGWRCHTDYALHGVFQHVDDVLAQFPRSWRRDFPRSRPTTYDGRLDDEGLLQVLAALRDAGGLLAVHCENHHHPFSGDKLRRRLRTIP